MDLMDLMEWIEWIEWIEWMDEGGGDLSPFESETVSEVKH